jgi:hypothetical protein
MHLMTRTLRILAPVATLMLGAAALSACMVIPDSAIAGSAPAAEGSRVTLGQAVRVGAVIVTPQEVVEDSRCPINARCVWAGRLVVRTRIDGAGWRETDNLTLGEDYGTHDVVFALVSGEPAPEAGEDREIKPADYRFTFEAR